MMHKRVHKKKGPWFPSERPQGLKEKSIYIFEEEFGPVRPRERPKGGYSGAADVVLRDLMYSGNELAELEFGRRRVDDFLKQHPTLPTSIGGRVVQFVYENSQIKCFLEVPACSSFRDFRQENSAVRRITKALIPHQTTGITSHVFRMYRLGDSYADIAKSLNHELEKALIRHQRLQFESLRSANGTVQKKDAASTTNHDLDHCHYLLRKVGRFKTKEIDPLIRDCLDEIRIQLRLHKAVEPRELSTEELLEHPDLQGLLELPPDQPEQPEPQGPKEPWQIAVLDLTKKIDPAMGWVTPRFRSHRRGKPYMEPITPNM